MQDRELIVPPNDLAAAWWQAEEGMKDLAAAIDPTMPVETIVATAKRRLTG